MELTTVGTLATIMAALVGGIPSLFTAFASTLPPLVSTVIGSLQGPILALQNGLGSCCICIPIPLAFGVFALHQRVKASAVEETR